MSSPDPFPDPFLDSMTFANLGCTDPSCADSACMPSNLQGYIRDFKRRKIKVDTDCASISKSTMNFFGNLDALSGSGVPEEEKQTRVVMHSGGTVKVNKIIMPSWCGDQKPVLEFCGSRDRFYVLNWRSGIAAESKGPTELKIELLGSGVVGTDEEIKSRTPLSTYVSGGNSEVYHFKGSAGDDGLRAVGFVFGGDYNSSGDVNAEIYVFKVVGSGTEGDEIGSEVRKVMEGLEEGLVNEKVTKRLNEIIEDLESLKK
mmetsp:Transcript_25328/g.47582  ORF Transcript_25328/g.47582 Transcript_25328/m.47582 type:complete len:258 (-) Transcript_25328:10-783(-)